MYWYKLRSYDRFHKKYGFCYQYYMDEASKQQGAVEASEARDNNNHQANNGVDNPMTRRAMGVEL